MVRGERVREGVMRGCERAVWEGDYRRVVGLLLYGGTRVVQGERG